MAELQRYTDVVIISYLLITAALALGFHRNVPHWRTHVGVHILTSVLIIWSHTAVGSLPQPFRFLRDWYPALAFPVLYKEVERFAAAFGNWGLTPRLQKLEIRLFRGHPSVYLSQRLPWLLLSEYLHFCYLFYTLLLPVIGGYWYFTGRLAAFHELLFLLCVTYTLSYLFYMLFPVDSPFYLFEPLEEPMAHGIFYKLVRFISSNGGARGGAFPSSHVSVATVIWLVTLFADRQLAYLITPIVIGLIFATVYGRFHYMLDLIAGLALGGAIFLIYRLFA